MGFLLVANPDAGSRDGHGLIREARRRLPDVEVLELRPETDLGAAVSEAIGQDRVVVAAGGDGTVNALVQHLVGRGTLGVLPAGTLNHFARDLGVRDPMIALRALQAGDVARVDVGAAGDRHFVNNVSLGLYPEVVRERERGDPGGRLATAAATAAATVRSLREARPLTGTIEADGDAKALFAWIVFVGNNRFTATPGRLGERDRLDEGVLDVRILLARRRAGARARMAWHILRRRPWETRRRLVSRAAHRVVVRLEGRSRPASVDGEPGEPVGLLEVHIVPRGLRVVTAPTGRPAQSV